MRNSHEEAKERVRAAIVSSGYLLPNKHIAVNLAPAELLQEDPICELSMAVGILLASGQIKSLRLELAPQCSLL